MAAKKKASKASGKGGKSAAKKESPAAATTRATRGESAAAAPSPRTGSKRKASPSPVVTKKETSAAKKGRTASPSPAPASRQSRSRGASSKAEPKPSPAQGSNKGKATRAESKSRVTRAVVEEVDTKKVDTSRGRSASRRTAAPSTPKQKTVAPKSETPKQKIGNSKQKNETPKQKVATPKRSVTPRQKAETPKQKDVATPKRSATPKQKAETPKQKAGATPKRSITPKQKAATPKQKVETPKQSRSRSATPRSKPEPPKEKATPKAVSKKVKAVAVPKQKAPKQSPKASPVAKSSPQKSPKNVTEKSSSRSSSRSRKSDSKVEEMNEPEEKEAMDVNDDAKATVEDQDNQEPKGEDIEKEIEKEETQSNNEAEPKSSTETKENKPESSKETEEEVVPEKSECSMETDEVAENDEPESKATEEENVEEDAGTSVSEEAEDAVTVSEVKEQSDEEDEEQKIVKKVDKVAEEKVYESSDVNTTKTTPPMETKETAGEIEEISDQSECVEDQKLAVEEEDMAEEEDENVEEDQEVEDQEVDEKSKVEAESTKTGEVEVISDQEEIQEEPERNSEAKDVDEDEIENQAESEQVEESTQKELESAESDQIESVVEMHQIESNVVKVDQRKDSTAAVEEVADDSVEVISDSSEPEAQEVISEPEAQEVISESEVQEVIDINEDSGEAIIMEGEVDPVQQENGSGDSKESEDKTPVEQNIQEISDDEDDVEEIGLTSEAGMGAEEDVQIIEDRNLTGIEEAKEAMEVTIPSEPVPNGATNDESSQRKRKFDEVDDGEDDTSHKKVRTSLDGQNLENGCVTQDVDVAKDYVVVEIGDVPPSDSQEVLDSAPKEQVQNNVSQNEGDNPIFNRSFIPNPSFTNVGDTAKQFSLVSYNILADCHLLRNDYSFTSKEYLKPEYRLKNLTEELKYLNADVVCLQEVDPQFFSNDLLPTLKSLGYDGIHKKRTAETVDEGEATFYKVERFTLVESSLVKIADLVEKELVDSIDAGVRDAVRKYMDLCDVLVVTKLRCNNTGQEVTIGNIHVVWGEMKIPDAQCVQIASAIKNIVSRAGSDNHAHIICGDFNSPPMSPGYLVAKDGYPSGDETITHLQQIKGLQQADGQAAALVNCIWPAFQHTSSSLKSAYQVTQGTEPSITSYNGVMCECVDYIFYSSTSLDTVGVFQTASKEKIMETGGTPNQFFPSDHVSMKAVLTFK